MVDKKSGKRPVQKEPVRRLHIFYSGRVQGIGFRFTAEEIARMMKLTGWVRNLPDGRVEVVCEGSEEVLKLFIEKIQQSPLGRYITKTQCSYEEPTGEFTHFRIEFCY